METDVNRQITKTVRDERFIRRLIVFVVCLIISFLIWASIKQSDSYTLGAFYPVKWANLPEGKLLVSQPDSTLYLNVETKGFNVFSTNLSRRDTIVFDLRKLKLKKDQHGYQAELELYSHKQSMVKHLSAVTDIYSISPDKMTFRFVDMYRKKVPIVPDVKYNLDKQYYLFSSIQCTPDSVIISGSREAVASITSIRTEPVDFQLVNGSVSKVTPLRQPNKQSLLKINKKQVVISLPAEQFTENFIEVPIHVINQDEQEKIKVFPDKVHINYLVALDRFKQVLPDQFVASVDAQKRKTGKKMTVELVSQPGHVKVTRIRPERVEYIIIR